MTSPSNNDRFNSEAATWDSNPTTRLSSQLAFKSIVASISEFQGLSDSEDPKLDILEIGCGTGLLTLLLSPHVRSITAVDTSQGMIDALSAKLACSNPPVKNMLPICTTLTSSSDPVLATDPVTGESISDRKFGLIVSHLVMYHIPSLEYIQKTMFGCLKKGGRVALTDFENFGDEARRFHPESKTVGVERHGLGREEMKRLLEDVGFEDVSVEGAFEVEKDVETVPGKGMEGKKMVFPFLLCLGRKS